jgi:hypothetical protein
VSPAVASPGAASVPHDLTGIVIQPGWGRGMAQHRIFTTSVYPLYVQKVARTDRSKAEVDQIITWLTGYDFAGLHQAVADEVDVATFFAGAPAMNPDAALIKGVICGYRVEEIEDPLMQKIRGTSTSWSTSSSAARR